MNYEIVRPADVFPPVSQYSHAVRADTSRIVYLAGQIAVNEQGNIVGPGDCGAQTRQVFGNIERVLAATGASWGTVVRLTTYLTRVEDIPAYRAIREELFSTLYPTAEYPAHTLLVVQALAAPEYLVEIEATAIL